MEEFELKEAHLEFAKHFRHMKNMFGVEDDLIINMDETSIYYEPEINKTFVSKGKKKVSINLIRFPSKQPEQPVNAPGCWPCPLAGKN